VNVECSQLVLAKLKPRQREMLVQQRWTDELFEDLVGSSEPREKEQLLRQKASFVNSISDDAFVAAYLGREMQERYARRVFKYIVHKFRMWVYEVLLREQGHEGTSHLSGDGNNSIDSDFSVHDYFGVMFQDTDCGSGEFELVDV
jgi:hypothetical protein